MNYLFNANMNMNMNKNKNKVVFIIGATGTGKSRLSTDIATRIPSEIINSDKIQVHKGLDIITNKISETEKKGIPHHLLGTIEPDSDFTAADFCNRVVAAVEEILRSGKVPIIVGGSNSYIEALVEEHFLKFKSLYDCCFIWLDVSIPVLFSFVYKRVDQMVNAGLIEEVRGIYVPNADYSKGIRRAIGVPELHKYFENEKEMDETSKKLVLENAIEEIKRNTCKLVFRQLEKIERLKNQHNWKIHRIDATRVFKIYVKEEANSARHQEFDDAWMELVLKICFGILIDFLKEDLKVDEDAEYIVAPIPSQELKGKN